MTRNPSQLRKTADLYRRMTRLVTDSTALTAISSMVGEFEATADEIERRERIRKRAHEVWNEHGRPVGRDVEFWLTAEHQIDQPMRRSA